MSELHPLRAVLGLVGTLAVIATCTVAVRWAYGAYDEGTELVGTFPRAGQNLVPGSDVEHRGVDVGEVDHIELVDRQAEITFTITEDLEVPEDAVVTVRPKTLFGEKYLDLEFEDDDGPYLSDGDEVAEARTATEVEELVASSEPLLAEVDATELAQVVTSLSEVVEHQGDDIARAWESGAELSAVFADTIDAQTEALESWADFQEAIADTGPAFNEISANNNELLPEFVAAREDFERLLDTLGPFADRFAELLVTVRPDLDTIFEQGDNVVRVLVAREENIREVVRGLADYVEVFGEAAGAERLPDGSAFAYFKNFLDFRDIEALICRELGGAGDAGAPLLEALQTLDSPLDCDGGGDVALPDLGAPPPRVPAPGADPQSAVDALYGAVAQVDATQPAGLGSLVEGVLGGPAGSSAAGGEGGGS